MDDYACMFCDGHHGPERGLVNCVRILADRVKELESKLGAELNGSAMEARPDTREQQPKPLADSIDTGQPRGVTAAPSVSAAYWHHSAERMEHVINGWAGNDRIPALFSVDDAKRLANAYRLAAAVTEWWSDDENNVGGADYEQRLFNVVTAFVRGEPLPQKGG